MSFLNHSLCQLIVQTVLNHSLNLHPHPEQHLLAHSLHLPHSRLPRNPHPHRSDLRSRLLLGFLLVKEFSYLNIKFNDKTRPEVYSCARVSTLPLSESVIPEMAKI